MFNRCLRSFVIPYASVCRHFLFVYTEHMCPCSLFISFSHLVEMVAHFELKYHFVILFVPILIFLPLPVQFEKCRQGSVAQKSFANSTDVLID